ncbi:MAG: hypothetical protein D5R98_10395 [Desulfonatronovibrio sp. MSAO_Bac4]|nr:MAG: hypothetical protein D5R98_10395 [Desulfonatronovibrio sp. MSAO_Bac4]
MTLIRSIVFLLCAMLLFACAPERIVTEPVRTDAQRMHQADRYWANENYAMSRDLYREISKLPDISPRQRLLVEQRLAISSFHVEDYQQAIESFKKWAELDPGIKRSWQWHEMYALSIKETSGDDDYLSYLLSVSKDRLFPQEINNNASLYLARFHFDQGRYPEAMTVLKNTYGQLTILNQKQDFEKSFHDYLSELSVQKLTQASSFIDQDKMYQFPFNIFFWSLYSAKLADDPSQWKSLQPRIAALHRQADFADPKPFARQFEQWMDKLGVPAHEVALLLPLSGQFSSTGWKILKGAGQAHWEMLASDTQVKIRTINTNSKDWIQELEKTNPTIVGGPVSGRTWDKIVDAGLNKEKTFFTFLPRIDDEGISGWRFFASPNDQVRSMINRAVEDLGFTDFGVFYPEDDFGRAYAQAFWEEANKKGVRVSGLMSYPGDEPSRWNDIVASFLNIKSKHTPYRHPEPDFQAVFIPDSLSRAKGLIPQFFYFDQNQLLFMGPMLWYQAYSPNTLEQQYFNLTMTPGPWWNEDLAAGAQDLISGFDETINTEPDFWVALGYDFVKFASEMQNLPSTSRHERINKVLAQNNFNNWSMAPIYWNEQGQAFQDLHVFQLSRESMVLTDTEYINSLIQIRKARQDQWIRMIREREEKQTSD